MKILITGGTGFIGQALCPRLAAAGHEVVILTRQATPQLPAGATTLINRLEDVHADSFRAIINLAGAPTDTHWTEKNKQLLIESRVGTTAKLMTWMRRALQPPATFISASAVGYYGEQGDREVTEDTAPSPGFTHDLCAAWEKEAAKAGDIGLRVRMRVCVMRIGVVLDIGGGALGKMLPAFRLGVGGRLGSGRQYFPWIHREDLVSLCQWLLENPSARGAYNACAPNPVTNAEFTRALGKALGRPTLLPMPAMALKLLFGEMAALLLMSDRMLPKRAVEEGFKFKYPELEGALESILAR